MVQSRSGESGSSSPLRGAATRIAGLPGACDGDASSSPLRGAATLHVTAGARHVLVIIAPTRGSNSPARSSCPPWGVVIIAPTRGSNMKVLGALLNLIGGSSSPLRGAATADPGSLGS